MANEVEILVTSKNDAASGFNEAEKSANKFTGAVDKIKGVADVAATAVIGGFLGAAKAVGDAASQQEQAMGGVDAVFKQNANTIKAWADTAAQSVGLSKTEYATLANQIGASFKASGVPMDELAGKTDNMIKLGSDLAATFGGTTKDAVEALGGAYRGEFDPLERYGIALKQSDVAAKMAADGTDKLTGQSAKLAQQQAITELVMQQSADAQGQFGREADTAAGAAQRQAAEWENLQAQLGQQLLPILTELGTVLQGIMTWMSQNTEVVTAAVLAITGLAVAWGLVRGAMMAWTAISAVATAAQWALNVAMSANPISLVILAIGALVAAIVYLWNNSASFRQFFIDMWKAIWDFLKGIGNWFAGPFVNFFKGAWDAITNALRNAKDWIVNTWNGIGNTISGIVDKVKGFLGSMWNGLTSGLKSAVNGAIGLLNGLIRGVNTIIRGLNSVNPFGAIPQIPQVGYLARGGMGSGPTVVGERGPELVNLQPGSHVKPAGGTARALGGGGGGPVVIEIRSSGSAIDDMLVEILQKAVRVRGGDVQLVLGRN